MLVNRYSLQNSGKLRNYGTLVNSGMLNNSGTLNTYSGGTLNNLATLTNKSGAALNNFGNLSNSAKLDNSGAMGNQGVLNNSGTFNNHSGGTLGNNVVFNNTGTLNNSGAIFNNPSGMLANNGSFTNDGTFFNSGTVSGTGTFTQTAGSSQIEGSLSQSRITIDGGKLYGNGTIIGAVFNNGGAVQGGSKNVPGTLNLSGSFIQGAGGALQELITGPASFSTLNITGLAMLGGSLNIVTGSGFSFSAGQTFDIASFAPGGLIGQFASIRDGSFSGYGNSVNIGNNEILKVTYNNNLGGIQLQVVAVPEPAEYSLMLAGLGLLGFLVRRKKIASPGS